MEQSNTIRKVLKNEVVQIAGIIASVWFFVQNVVLPINDIQNQLVAVNATLSEMKELRDGQNVEIARNSTDITILKEQVKVLQSQ